MPSISGRSADAVTSRGCDVPAPHRGPVRPGREPGPPRVRIARRVDRAGRARRPDGARRHASVLTMRVLPQAFSPGFLALAAGAATATVIDIRTRRIPNVVTGTLAAVGVGLAAAGISGVS